MLPFAETVLAWRLHRGMTQAQLARTANVPRPNLSAIERGDREVTLKTLRALAAALDIRPGILADGEPPNAGAPPLNRATLERIARAAAGGSTLADPRESALAHALRGAMSSRVPSRGTGKSKHGHAGTDRAYFFLRTAESQETVASLVGRTMGRLATK